MSISKKTHYIVIVGGVLSGSGKGITAASIGACMQARGLRVNIQKFDMYLNVDAGTLRPGKHGEVYVTTDGAETDLDLGHYERFLDKQLDHSSSIMQGRVLLDIINRERAGEYGGDDIQVIPHVTNDIQDKVISAGNGHDVHIIELGGTVGDYEGLAFVEAARQLAHKVGRSNVTYIHVVYMPYLRTSGEIKTKPAQNAARHLRSIGIIPDILVARCDHRGNRSLREKLSLFTDVKLESVVILEDVKTVYEVPLILERRGIGKQLATRIGCRRIPDLSAWQKVVSTATKQYPQTISIGLVAKYLDNLDTYMSVTEAMQAAAWASSVNLKLNWINAEELEAKTQSALEKQLNQLDGIIIPGGFGRRGIEGMIRAANYALKHNQPYLGLCLGLQVAIIAFARQHGLPQANSKEFDSKAQLVITTMPGQENLKATGGTMRLGSYPCEVQPGTLAHKLYGVDQIEERHRHRFEFNPAYKDALEKAGLVISGICPQNDLIEMIEIPTSDYFIGCQFHPEFASRPTKPHPLFCGLIQSALNRSQQAH